MSRPATIWTILLSCLSVFLAGCAHRGTGEYTVDEIQGFANAVEKHLRNMRGALRNKDLDKAEDEYEHAREALQDNRTALAAYPDVGELETSVGEAPKTLCYHHVSLALEGFFGLIRARGLGDAREQLEKARSEHGRCKAQISDRDDYMPLKMNLDSAPRALVDLERELARPALLERIAAAKKGLQEQKAAIRGKLEEIARRPKQRQLAMEVDAALKTLREDLARQPDFGGEPEWTGYAASLTGELVDLQRRLTTLSRRGKLLLVVEDRLPRAEKAIASAAAAKDEEKDLARKLLNEALQNYEQCQQVVAELLSEEPGLAKYAFSHQGRERKTTWLKKHLKRSITAVERKLRRLDAKPAPKAKKKKKKKRRKRRVRRW